MSKISFASVLFAFVLLAPVLLMGGYALHSPPEPKIASVLQENLALEEGTADEIYLYYVTKGPLKGQTADGVMVIATMTREQLVAAGATEGVYLRVECANYSTTGDPLALNGETAQHCVSTKVTEQAVREYAQSLAQPPGVA
jgi:hypothetical protein